MAAASGGSGPLKEDRLRALPQRHFAKRSQLLQSFDNGQKMVAGELADLAREPGGAIGEQDLGLADPAGMQQYLARRRIARRILVADPEIERAERDPARLAAPAHMDNALMVRQHRLEPLAGSRRGGPLKPGHKRETARR